MQPTLCTSKDQRSLPLPRYVFADEVQIALIDGLHGYPLPTWNTFIYTRWLRLAGSYLWTILLSRRSGEC
jgi:hypothetical protein